MLERTVTSHSPIKASKRSTSALPFKLLLAALLTGGNWLSTVSALAAGPAPGTVIQNQATGSFVNPNDSSTNNIESNIVQVTVAEVAGITITSTTIPTEAPSGVTGAGPQQGNGAINAEDVIYFTYTFTNIGNDPTQFFIPGAPSAVTNASFGPAGPIQVLGFDLDGSGTTPPTTLSSPVDVPGAGATTQALNIPGLVDGSVPADGTVTVQVPVKANAGLSNGSTVTVVLGDVSPNDNSPATQNQPFVAGTQDAYTVDNADGVTNEASDSPINGDATNHRQEASASQTATIAAVPFQNVLPLSCPQQAIQIQGLDSLINQVNLVTGATDAANDNFNQQINAIGYNPTDNRIWGASRRTNGSLTVTGLDASGDFFTEETAIISGLPGSRFNIGDVSDDGRLYMYAGTSNSQFDGRFYVVDVNSASPTFLQLVDVDGDTTPGTPVFSGNQSADPQLSDWAFHPNDGQLYALNDLNRNLYRINPTTGASVNLGPTNVPSGVFGAVFFDSNGFFYAYNNSNGQIYRVDLRVPPATDYDENLTSFFATSSTANRNDGARCRDAALPIDFGDAPDTGSGTGSGNYNTLLSDDGPRHIVDGSTFLGSAVSNDTDGFGEGTDANGDATDDADDDGVQLSSSSLQGQSLTPGNAVTLDITTAGSGVLNAWMDWNSDGDFDDTGEQIATNAVDGGAGDADSTADGTITLSVAVPATATLGETYARFRYSSDTDLSPTGAASDGEVEDYQVAISTSSTPPPVTGPGDGNACLLTHHNNSGVAAEPNHFYEITDHTNPATLSEIGPWNVPSGTVEGLTANVSTGTVYALNANRSGELYLGIIDPATGSFSDITTTGVTTLSHATHGTLSVVQTRAMAHQPGTNIIWAAAYDTQPTTGPGTNFYYLFKIDATTGAAITGAFGPGNDYLAIDLSPYETVRATQSATIEALTFYQGNPNFLYGVVSTDRGGRSTNIGHLFTVNVAAANPTATLAPQNLSGTAITGGNAPVSTIYDIEGMSFDENNDLVIVSSNAGGPNANSLFFVNTATGAAFGQRNIIAGDWEGIVCNTPSPVVSDPNVLLVKRITAINGNRVINPNDSTPLNTFVDGGTANDGDNHPNWPSNYLVGEINAGLTKPGDEIEYTIYFLSTGGKEAVDVTLCDRVPDFQTFVPDVFNSVPPAPNGGAGANRGILVEYDTTTLSYSNDIDGDMAEHYPPTSMLPPACAVSLPQLKEEDNGAIVVNLGNLPNATSTSTPTDSYGAIRFRATVK